MSIVLVCEEPIHIARYGGDVAFQAGLISNNMKGFRVECTDTNSIIENINNNLKNDLFQIERIQLDFRFDASKSQLRLMTFCSPWNVDINKIKNNNCQHFLSEKYCEKIELDEFSNKVICPLCIDTNISANILNAFSGIIDKIATQNNFKVFTLRDYTMFKSL